MSGFGKIYESSNWGVGVCDNTIGWGSSYKSIANCTDASFSYSADSFAQNGSNPTPTITGDAGGTFTATPSGLSLNASTGEITLSTSTINSYTIRYTLPDTTFAEQTVGITAAPFASTRSFSFDGVNDYFDLGTDSSLDIFGGDFSVSLWFNHSNSTGGARAMIEIGASSYSANMAITLGFTSNTGVGFAVGTTWLTNAGTGFNDGNWHHMVATRTGTTYKIYIDNTDISYITGGYSYTNANNIAKGNFGGNFGGKLDEIAFWNSTLSSDAVSEIYNNSVPNDLDELTNASDPTVWYRMGE